MWKNTADPDRPQIKTARRMPFACLILKATNTYLQYVIIIAFTLQHWLKNAPQCYVIHTVSLLSIIRIFLLRVFIFI